MQPRLDREWCLSWREVMERKRKLDTAIAHRDAKTIRREVRWWRQFERELRRMMVTEVEWAIEHPEEYEMLVFETDYFLHWEAQAMFANATSYAARRMMEVWYGGK